MKRVVILLCLFLYACSPVSSPYDNVEYRQGTEGLVVTFGDSPPAKVYRGSYLNLILETRNRGAYDLQDLYARVYVTGYDKSAIHFTEDSNSGYTMKGLPAIKGKNPYNMDGGYDYVEFEETAVVNVPFGDVYTPTLMVTSCYQYQTLATPAVCVVSDPNAIIKDDVCRPDTIELTSQGGPVAVTKIEEEVMQQMLNFVITIENVGDGKVIDKNQLTKCPFKLEHSDVNMVDVSVALSGAGTPSCTPEDKRVRLVDGRGIIYCAIPIEIETSYTSPLVVTLDYGYSSSTTRQVEITNPPGVSTGGGSGTNDGPAPFDTETPQDDTNDPGGTNNQNNIDPDDPANVPVPGQDTIVPDSTCKCTTAPAGYNPGAPCLCIYMGGSNKFCDVTRDDYTIQVSSANPVFTVYGSDSRFESCGISTDLGPCGTARTYALNLQQGVETTVNVIAQGPGVQQSQRCKVVWN